MRLLLDTHTAIWAITTPSRMPAHIQAMINEAGNEVVVSAASIWEISIKHALRRGGPDMPISGSDALLYFTAAGFRILPIAPEHAAAVDDLPTLHADPFDRLLVAQALNVPLRLVTHDERVASYSESVIRF